MRRALIGALLFTALAAPVSAVPRSRTAPADQTAIHLDWAALPNAKDLERDYPREAQERGVSGDTQIECSVEPDGTLAECETLEEKPPGMGFAQAAIEASRKFRMTPYRAALIHGQLPHVIVPIHWEVAPTTQGSAAPSSRAAASAPPAKAQTAPEPFPGFFAVFPIFFIALWLAVTSILGVMSGWFGLAERFPDRREPTLAKIGGLSGMMGIGVSMRGILTLTACQSGLRVSIWRIFGPFSRPFLVPWREISTRPVTIFFTPHGPAQFRQSGSRRPER